MLALRFVLIGLASLNCAWALSNFLTEYFRFMLQNFDPLFQSAPIDPTGIYTWLVLAVASGMGAAVLFRSSYLKRKQSAKVLVVPVQTQQSEQKVSKAA